METSLWKIKPHAMPELLVIVFVEEKWRLQKLKVENQTYPSMTAYGSKLIEKYLAGNRSPAVIKSYERFMVQGERKKYSICTLGISNEEVHPSLDT